MKTKVVMLGTGSVIPSQARVGVGTLVLANDETMLFDCGPGVSNRLTQYGVEGKDLSAIFISHTHLDHVLDLPVIFFWSFWNGRKTPIEIYGPVGVKAHVDNLFGEMFGYISRLMAERGKFFAYQVHEATGGACLERGGVKVEAFAVSHGNMPSLGYRVDSQGGSVGISGDTAPCDNLIEVCAGVDILVHECAFPDSAGEIPSHTIPRQLSSIAAQVNPKVLVMNHFFPICDSQREDMIASVAIKYGGKIIFAQDLEEIVIG